MTHRRRHGATPWRTEPQTHDEMDGMKIIEAYRRMPLTRSEARAMRLLSAKGADLVWSKGSRVCYIELERVSLPVMRRLLLRVWISSAYESNTHDYIIYTLNEDGRAAAAKIPPEPERRRGTRPFGLLP